MTAPVGFHASLRRGFLDAIRRVKNAGAGTVQLLTFNPRLWRRPHQDLSEEELAAFRRERESLGLFPLVLHSPFVPNLATSQEAVFQRSVRALAEDLRRSESLGAEYLVIHVGAHSPGATPQAGLDRFVVGVRGALAAVPGRVRLLIENVAGGGRRLGGDFDDLAHLLNGLDGPRRPGICFDTCHAYAAGYDLASRDGVDAVLKDFAAVGLGEIKVFHVNDSGGALKSRLDIHEHLGKGRIGLEGLKDFFTRAARRDAAYILETPADVRADLLADLEKLRGCLSGLN